jgi:hypothetical protein
MAYIGKEPIVGNFQVCDAISVVNGQAAYTMQVSSTNVVPESANHMLVSLNGILQKPGSSFTVSGSTITFASNLATGDVIDFIMLLGNVLDIGTPSDSTVTDAKANFVSTSSAAGLQIKGDGTTDGTLQLNCSQNSHGIKLKSPAHSAGQSYTLTFPTTAPSSGKALVTDGSGNLSFSSAGGLNLIKTTAITSGVAQVDFDNTYVNSTYNNYKMIIRGLSTSADNQDVYIKFSVDNGSNFITMVGARINVQINSSSQPQGGMGNLSGGFPLGSDEESDDTKQVNAEMTFYDLNSNNTYKFGTGMATVVNQNGDLYSYTVSGYGSSTSAVNFIRVYTLTGGNLDDGSISLYGFSE